jgi:P pilus assembly chaperone PapD
MFRSTAPWRRPLAALACLSGLLAIAPPAQAEIVLSQVIVDLQPGSPGHSDIEVWNAGKERAYVVAEPSEVVSPGLAGEKRTAHADPSVSGLLVTPQRMVLEPGQRRILRVSAVAPRGNAERIYRVLVKPVAGPLSADATALKVFVGYDVLILYRPAAISGAITANRTGKRIAFQNDSNTAQELFDGKQCDRQGKDCRDLPATRLYSGATWQFDMPYDTPVEYRVSSGGGSSVRKF